MSETGGIPCPFELVTGFAELAGASMSGARLLPSATNAVWLLPQAGLVLRVAGLDWDRDALTHLVQLTGLLAGAGVPVVAPAGGVLACQGRLASIWHVVETAAALDWAAFGAATRQLHVLGAQTLRRAAALPGTAELAAAVPRALDVELLAGQLDQARRGGLEIEVAELLTGRLAHLERSIDRLGLTQLSGPHAGDDPRAVLVHDDLWAKNVIATSPAGGPAAVLADCDGLSWGPPGYDLAFVAGSFERGSVSAQQVSAFTHGYGAALPEREICHVFALAHQLRRVLMMSARRAWMPARAAVLLAGDLNALIDL